MTKKNKGLIFALKTLFSLDVSNNIHSPINTRDIVNLSNEKIKLKYLGIIIPFLIASRILLKKDSNVYTLNKSKMKYLKLPQKINKSWYKASIEYTIVYGDNLSYMTTRKVFNVSFNVGRAIYDICNIDPTLKARRVSDSMALLCAFRFFKVSHRVYRKSKHYDTLTFDITKDIHFSSRLKCPNLPKFTMTTRSQRRVARSNEIWKDFTNFKFRQEKINTYFI